MKKFALITHLPARESELNELFYPPLILRKLFPKVIFDKIFKFFPPCSMSFVKSIETISNSKTAGWVIVCPLFPENFLRFDEKAVIKKIANACRYAQLKGAHIAGLAAFTSIVGNEGEEVSNKVNLAITSGNTYTAFLAIDGLLKAATNLELNPKDVSLCIIGATGDIGSICTKILAKTFKNIILVGRDHSKLNNFAKTIEAKIKIETNSKEAIKNADLILCVASSVFPLFDVKELKKGAVVCDVSIPPAIPKINSNFRNDVLIFDGGKAKINTKGNVGNKEWQKLFPDNVIFGCLAETMILALDERIENFSIGRGNITEEKINIIANLSKKHGFETAPFKFGNYYYSKNDIEAIKRARKNE